MKQMEVNETRKTNQVGMMFANGGILEAPPAVWIAALIDCLPENQKNAVFARVRQMLLRAKIRPQGIKVS